jgi:hypothetical protein
VRVADNAHAAKKLKEKTNTSVVKQPPNKQKLKKSKDGWEMSAQDALLVNFVVCEI